MTATISPNNNDSANSLGGKHVKERPKRAFAACTPKWQRFQQTLIIPSEKAAVSASETSTYLYNRQYSHVYANRLTALKNRCWNAIKSSSKSKAVEAKCVLELKEGMSMSVQVALQRAVESNSMNESLKCAVVSPNLCTTKISLSISLRRPKLDRRYAR